MIIVVNVISFLKNEQCEALFATSNVNYKNSWRSYTDFIYSYFLATECYHDINKVKVNETTAASFQDFISSQLLLHVIEFTVKESGQRDSG